MNLNFFRIKTEIETRIEEYFIYKSRDSAIIAQKHKEILTEFRKHFKYKSVKEMSLSDADLFHKHIIASKTAYTVIKYMEALRSFMRYTRKLHDIDPDMITNEGIIFLPSVTKSDIIPPMIKKKTGRPANIPFIKDVQLLKKRTKLGIRAIARAKKVNPGAVHRALNYRDVTKELSTV